MSKILLNELNAFRAIDGKEALKDWRNARHMPMLEAYRADEVAVKAVAIDAEIADDFEASEAELAAQVGRQSADLARDEQLVEAVRDDKKEVAPVAKVETKQGDVPSYKNMVRHEKSTIEKPLATIHAFLDANVGMKRKDAIAVLVEQGINFYTARTQYQRWFTNKKEK